MEEYKTAGQGAGGPRRKRRTTPCPVLRRCPNEQFSQLIEAELMAIDFVWRSADSTF